MLALSLIIAAGICIIWQSTPRERARRAYYKAKHKTVGSYSDWFDSTFSLFPTAALRRDFNQFVDGAVEVIRFRKGDESRTYEVVVAVMRNTPEAACQNPWSALHAAKNNSGLLDDQLMPV